MSRGDYRRRCEEYSPDFVIPKERVRIPYFFHENKCARKCGHKGKHRNLKGREW